MNTDQDLLTDADEQVATDGDAPIGTLKMNTGGGINNYVPPSLPAQGALARLYATKDEK
jgi:hypothetical protein